MTDFQNGNGRSMWAWIARSAILALAGIATYMAQDSRNTVHRIEERLRNVEITVPSQYITRDETEALLSATERRIYRRLDRELDRNRFSDPRRDAGD